MRIGIQETDRQWKRRSRRNMAPARMPMAQAALVALDAQTGEVKALVGGRSYGRRSVNSIMQPRSASRDRPFQALCIRRGARLGSRGRRPGVDRREHRRR